MKASPTCPVRVPVQTTVTQLYLVLSGYSGRGETGDAADAGAADTAAAHQPAAARLPACHRIPATHGGVH